MTTYHLALSVRGALAWSRKEFREATVWIKRDDGSPMTPEQIREALYDELAKGHERIPMGACDNFDPKTGCRGHAQPIEGGQNA